MQYREILAPQEGVFCWKDDSYLFAESERYKHDRIRDTQQKWLEAALDQGLPTASFLVVEWSIVFKKEVRNEA